MTEETPLWLHPLDCDCVDDHLANLAEQFDAYDRPAPPTDWDGKTDHLYIVDERFIRHGDHPFDADWDCCVEAVGRLMGYSWAKFQADRARDD